MKKRRSFDNAAGRLFLFALRVLRGFKHNQGFLLSGAVAYYSLLSIVPFSILALVVLTHLMDEQRLINTLATYLGMMVPGYAVPLTAQARDFLEHRQAIGIIGFLFMLFFSSIAFSVIEQAMAVIFAKRVTVKRRNFVVSAFIPYVYMLAMGIGILAVSVLVGAIETFQSRHAAFLGWRLNLGGAIGLSIYAVGIVGEALILTSFYLVMPQVRVRLRHALVGGVSATVLWEIVRRILVWYYADISMVTTIYGSIASVVVALLSIEVVAVILLLGAQVIAELDPRTEAMLGARS